MEWGLIFNPGCVSIQGLQPSKPAFKGQVSHNTAPRPAHQVFQIQRMPQIHLWNLSSSLQQLRVDSEDTQLLSYSPGSRVPGCSGEATRKIRREICQWSIHPIWFPGPLSARPSILKLMEDPDPESGHISWHLNRVAAHAGNTAWLTTMIILVL